MAIRGSGRVRRVTGFSWVRSPPIDRISHYQIVRPLGAGAMGEVFLATDERLRRQVAIKVLSSGLTADADQRGRFVREARAASALNHPNVCTIFEIGETAEGLPFLAMEFIEGQTLDELVVTGPIPTADAINYGIQVADALDAAHSADIVHRDIKPANIAIDPRGRVKVLDFGLAKRLDSAAETESLAVETQQGAVLGTPAFMSPEQARGLPVDHRSDLFSLGSVLYQLITGRLPFAGSSIAEVMSKVVGEAPEAIARFNYEVPQELERIVLKLLAKDPENRYQTARDLMVDLRALDHVLQSGQQASGAQPKSSVDFEQSESLPPGASPATVALPGPDTALEGTPAVPAVSSLSPAPDPEQLARCDVVITYANLDDQPVVSGQSGWISKLQRNLELRVAQLTGSATVLKQAEPLPEEDRRVMELVPRAKTIVSVLSPPFARSESCCRLVKTFWESAERSGDFRVGDGARILNVVKTPVDPTEVPRELEPLYSELVPYEFFEQDPVSGRIQDFDEIFGEAARQRFYERVYDLALDVSRVLRNLSAPGAAEPEEGRKRVYLAATTSDLTPQRDLLRRQLVSWGHEVLPRQTLPLVASEIESVMQACLGDCDLAIHFVGAHYGLVPEATDLSVVALQNKVAQRFSDERGLPRLIWHPSGIEPEGERQRAFFWELKEDAAARRGAELVIDTFENFRSLLRTRWKREAEARRAREAARTRAAESEARKTASSSPSSEPSSASSPPRVYLICDPEDEQAVEPLEDFFYEQGIEVTFPAFDADESQLQEIHVQNLRDCDAVLIFYGVSGKHWVDFSVRDLQKAMGYRSGRALAASAVYVAPPFDRRKERFRSVSVEVLRPEGAELEAELLSSFVSSLRESSEGGER